MAKFITVVNNGADIASTDYFQSEHAANGFFFLSVNAGCFRLLVPEVQRATLSEMRTAREVVISRGPWPAQRRTDALELLFDDDSDSPFALHLGVEQVDRMPTREDQDQPGKPTRWRFAAWTTAGKQLELSCRYRVVDHIPHLQSF